jgi:hypothetical protein
MVEEPHVFLTLERAQDVIEVYNVYGIEMQVVEFVRKP